MDPEKLRICVHCGLCLEACPTYRVLKNEADSPRGRISLLRAIQEGRIPMTETAFSHLDGCLDCRACETACPAGVPYGELIEEGRKELYPKLRGFKKREILKRFFLTKILPYPKRIDFLGRLLFFYRKSGLRFLLGISGIFHLLPSWMKKGEKLFFSGKKPSRSAHRKAFAASHDTKPVPKARVALFQGCIARFLFPDVEASAAALLSALECELVIPEEQTCCGALLVHGGLEEEALSLARKNLQAFKLESCDYITVTAAGCGSTLKEYSRLLSGDPQASRFSEKVIDIHQLIVRLGLSSSLNPLPIRVAYQDACHLLHAQGIRNEPRLLLKSIPSLELLEVPQSDWCCGSAGIYNLTHPEMAETLLKEKIQSLLSVKPDVVAVGNPGCALQLRMGLAEAGSKIPVVHPVELLLQSLEN